jgi:hypothetical protein
MAKLTKLAKANESITLNRYDNGWMIEVSGKSKKDDWTTIKVICNTEEEVLAIIKEWNSMELDN